MPCEVEFLPVGEGARAGDAIVVRYGDISNYALMVVDGGTVESGVAIVEHIKKHFGSDAKIKHAVLSHADNDHASGLREVLRALPVEHLWLHIPWLAAKDALQFFEYESWTVDGLTAAIKKEYDILAELLELAEKQGTTPHWPDQGTNIGPFVVLSPSYQEYVKLLPQFDKTPNPDMGLIEAAGLWIGKAVGTMLEKAAAKAERWIKESYENELLKDGGVTSASNESSLVLYSNWENRRLLLTGDAGVKALSWAAAYARKVGCPLQNFDFFQIPHHGSRRNVGPTILTELLGSIQPEGTRRFLAYASAPKDDARRRTG
jgi:beta-lactamase superfamily II metal-dependent hydrolase